MGEKELLVEQGQGWYVHPDSSGHVESENALDKTIAFQAVSRNPLMTTLLNSIHGMLAVVDRYRTVVAINSSFIEDLGIKDVHKTLGLKLGEVLGCVHALDEPGGCGATRYCASCGAALAILASGGHDKAAEELCALSRRDLEGHQDLFFKVKSNPVEIDGKRFVILLLQDVTEYQRKAVFERAFYHDMNNLLTGVVGAAAILMESKEQEEWARMVFGASKRLANAVKIQQCLSKDETACYQPVPEKLQVKQVYGELELFLHNHPAGIEKFIDYKDQFLDVFFVTDLSLLVRILFNMVLNGLEASDAGEKVSVWVEAIDDAVCFNVWNSAKIPQRIMPRIFERNFSTKAKTGRGVGTYSMKLFGEKLLNGVVDCTTADTGTIFSIRLPAF